MNKIYKEDVFWIDLPDGQRVAWYGLTQKQAHEMRRFVKNVSFEYAHGGPEFDEQVSPDGVRYGSTTVLQYRADATTYRRERIEGGNPFTEEEEARYNASLKAGFKKEMECVPSLGPAKKQLLRLKIQQVSK